MFRTNVLAAFLFVLVAIFPLMAQAESDHDKEDSIQVGYAIITPVTPEGAPLQSNTNLFAFETFGEKKGISITTAGVLPSNMATSTMLYVNTSGRLSRNVGVAIVNPVGSQALSTEITMTLKAEDGSQVGQTKISLPAGNQTAAYVDQMFEKEKDVPRDFVGTLTISSSKNPVAMMGLRFRGENFSTLPLVTLGETSAVPLNGFVGGAGAIILPQFAVGGGWESEIVLVNSGSDPIQVRVDLFESDGSALMVKLNGETKSSFTGISIPPGGVYVIARRDDNGDSEF